MCQCGCSHADQLLRGLYSPFLKIWLRWLPPTHILPLRYEAFQEDPDAVLSEVFSFLGLPGLKELHSTGAAGKVREAARAPLATDGLAPPIQHMDPHIRKQLKAFFAPFNRELEQMLADGSSVKAWNVGA